ncbi:peptidoglycan DD-metalloendopeptidase family protein [Caballeronia sp. LZ062]|uniref:peptidoglycan DD-metalloendopeptidase family protein n=1 Tax=unclassified Caballeronia TaxID=2646786 RepID=UPI002863CA1C|nr:MULTISPECIES: peptidoglycan DD-metalloendopeptidase family protein [unclassified Caballeronia]MDR5853688.1 peptidoglycan DD-metalloendopeptidase family protein [Caballeronia sp. LZ050]MDR5871779.1 peptidoglycan DD-metalloendopeptidase family protein [Caballeronia sp. LZ062]
MGKLESKHTVVIGPRTRAVIASLGVAAAVTAGLAGCTSTPRTPAPIVDNSIAPPPVIVSAPVSTAPVAAAPAATALAPVDAGFYRVKPGDTLYGISRQYKQKPADLAAWNSLPESKQVNVGQVLRVVPPGASASAAASVSSGKNLPPLLPTPGKPAAEKPAEKSAEKATEKPAARSSEAPASTASAGKGTFAWPAKGEIVRGFGASGSKGIDIAGKVGEPVKAAAPGKVVYAGSGLRSYGRMIIVRHSNDFLTAYAYNDKLLVREGDTVKQGATIADMGTGPSGSPVLHFEIRKAGAAVDPVPLLGAGS